jgi:hypothetical protein
MSDLHIIKRSQRWLVVGPFGPVSRRYHRWWFGAVYELLRCHGYL